MKLGELFAGFFVFGGAISNIFAGLVIAELPGHHFSMIPVTIDFALLTLGSFLLAYAFSQKSAGILEGEDTDLSTYDYFESLFF